MLLAAIGKPELDPDPARALPSIRRIGVAATDRKAYHDRDLRAGEQARARIGGSLGLTDKEALGAHALGVIFAEAGMGAINSFERLYHCIRARLLKRLGEQRGGGEYCGSGLR